MNAKSTPSPGAQSGAQGRPPYVVVAGVELDETGNHTLTEVFELAGREPFAAVHLVSVVTDVGLALRSEAGADEHASLLEERMFSLRAFVLKRWRSYPPNAAHRVMMHVGLGDCERELVQFAIDYEADLLVVGTHDRGRLAALLSPSLAGALAHGAPCPVLVARPRSYEGLSKSPSIEPPPLSPPAPHEHHRRSHRYRYSESLSFGTHDGNGTAGVGSSS
ncbi:MAG: universal stress protein [Polyangiaceae bacterium]|jgi:nucleotide-binding universal stress UspA family protein|nr:universal stress protein [Polyangiaceae bacterium]